ncbi:MAG: CGNR zinc finger domain-containing protein [Streptosporangiales bacterium]|nr:CGNR zinc finger domain-containing protein [Streptosporangiales bacterium]
MDFDSHSSDVVTQVLGLINAVTPGERRGRPMPAPEGSDLVRAVAGALAPARAAEPPGEGEAVELAAWAGRLRGVVERVDAGEVDAACAEMNAILRASGAIPTLARHDGEAWHLHFHSADASWAVGWAASMATALAVVLGDAAIDRLGVCRAPACDRVYVDVSRNGTRRFCSTACQNRVKAATFRARHTGSPTP